MSAPYYRLLVVLVASVSLLLGGCSRTRTVQADATVAELPQQAPQEASARPPGEMDTETTIWNLLGISKKQQQIGPVTGAGVSPILWQAVLDTLNFAKLDSVDPIAGLVVTEWYSPKAKPNDRLRVTAFVKARALRSDSIVVSVDRQTRGASGWQDAPVAADVAANLENDILERARQIHIARIREQQ
jgi:hypothetical protein